MLLGTSQGRVLRINGSGKPISLYDVGTAPIRLLETDRYLYIHTFTRLYVLEGNSLVGLQDCTTKCDLLDEGLVLLVENKGVRVLTEAGRPLGVALTKAPIRRLGIEGGACSRNANPSRLVHQPYGVAREQRRSSACCASRTFWSDVTHDHTQLWLRAIRDSDMEKVTFAQLLSKPPTFCAKPSIERQRITRREPRSGNCCLNEAKGSSAFSKTL